MSTIASQVPRRPDSFSPSLPPHLNRSFIRLYFTSDPLQHLTSRTHLSFNWLLVASLTVQEDGSLHSPPWSSSVSTKYLYLSTYLLPPSTHTDFSLSSSIASTEGWKALWSSSGFTLYKSLAWTVYTIVPRRDMDVQCSPGHCCYLWSPGLVTAVTALIA